MTLKEALNLFAIQANAIPQVAEAIVTEPEMISDQTAANYPLIVVSASSNQLNIDDRLAVVLKFSNRLTNII